MKKIFAFFLILAMLIPMGLVAQAEEVEKKPFTLVNWGAFEDIDPEIVKSFTNTFYMPYYWSNSGKIKAGEANAYCPAMGASTIPDLAACTKELFDTYPEGARHINFTMVATAAHALGDVCFLDAVVPLVSGWLDEFLTEYKRIGGKLDGLVIDVEYLYTSYYYIHSEFFTKDPLVYDKIVKNPIYREKIRPKLVEKGFQFYPNPTEHTPEIYSIHPKSGAQYDTSRGIWDAVLTAYKNQIITDSCAPLWKYYPDAVVCDYTVRDIKPWIRQMGDHGGIGGSSGGVINTAGNASNENFYSVRPSTNFFKDSNGGPDYKNVGTYTEAVFENNAFNRFLYETNIGKETVMGSTNGKVTYWMAHAYYGEARNPYVHSPYYAELLYHLSLLDPERFLGYILPQDCKTDGGQDAEKYGHALQIVDESLRKVSDLAGYKDRQRLPVSKAWNDHYVVTGMYANGRNIWRITPDNTIMARDDFQVKGTTDPTFKIQGTTVTFPGGKIVEESAVYEIGTCGYWVETPKDVYPVVTKEADYFKKYPAYSENFDGFEAGMEYNFNNALPAATWENRKNGTGSAVVAVDPANANNKVLAVKGSYNMKLVKLPGNITAGDSYAEHQAWEISFTLPSDMAADAELQLLNIIPEKKVGKDRGVKVIGGKLFYDQAGELVEMADVTLTAGTKYTVVREFDFTTADAYTCNYYVYAGDTLIGVANRIPVAKGTELPVYSISYSAKDVTGEAVLFDDFKLYQTKVNTDFNLYDGKTGVAVAEIDKAREGSVAYRFSWHNATNTEKSYTVMAAYYDGETKVSEEVIKEVKMAPNADNFEYGVVENKQAGKKMLVYVRDNNPPEADLMLPSTGEIADPEGTVVEEEPVNITVTKDDVVLWQGPGQEYGKADTVQNGEQLKISATYTVDGTVWGKVEGRGWIILGDTNYDEVVKSGDSKDNQLIIIIVAAVAAVVIVGVVVVIIVAAQKKKKATAAKPTTEEKSEE